MRGGTGPQLSPKLIKILEDPKKWKEYSEKADKKAKEHDKNLRKRGKQLYELLVQQDFVVESYVGTGKYHSIVTDPGSMGGPPGRSQRTGYSRTLEITVEPINNKKEVPVKTLVFYGDTQIRPGDTIRATIPCYKKEEFRSLPPHLRDRGVYIRRDLGEKEEAIQLELLVNGKVVGTEISVHYKKYQKQ